MTDKTTNKTKAILFVLSWFTRNTKNWHIVYNWLPYSKPIERDALCPDVLVANFQTFKKRKQSWLTSKMTINPANKTHACLTVMAPDAKGLFFVLSTKGSMFRSAMSFITHPAERITTTPTTNTSNSFGAGQPPAVNHRLHRVGHINK